VLGGFRHIGGQNQAALHIDGGVFFHPAKGDFVSNGPVRIDITLELQRLPVPVYLPLGRLPLLFLLLDPLIALGAGCGLDSPRRSLYEAEPKRASMAMPPSIEYPFRENCCSNSLWILPMTDGLIRFSPSRRLYKPEAENVRSTNDPAPIAEAVSR
jgi:hypothetical protein